jgi:transaldolase
MKIYGAGSLEDIRKCTELGVAGILTNPQGFDVYYKGEMTLPEITKAILDVSDSPVFIQVHGPNPNAIVERAREMRRFSSRVNAKIIADRKGFEAIRILQREGIDCIATCLFSLSQAAVAAMVGA